MPFLVQSFILDFFVFYFGASPGRKHWKSLGEKKFNFLTILVDLVKSKKFLNPYSSLITGENGSRTLITKVSLKADIWSLGVLLLAILPVKKGLKVLHFSLP